MALLDGDMGVGWGGWCQGLSLSKRNQLASSLGAERHISSAFTGQDCFHLHSPGRRAKRRPQPACQSHTLMHGHTHIHIHAETHRYTFPLSFLPDYNRIILTRSMHSQTCSIMWERWTVQKITIISAYI